MHESGPAPGEARGRSCVARAVRGRQQRPSALGQLFGSQLAGQVAHVFPHVTGQVLGQVPPHVAQVGAQVTQESWSTVTLSMPRTVPRPSAPSVVENDSTVRSSRCRFSLPIGHLAAGEERKGW